MQAENCFWEGTRCDESVSHGSGNSFCFRYMQSLPEGGCNRYQSTLYKPLVSSDATLIFPLGKTADNNEMFENDKPRDRAQLIEKLQAKGLPAFEFDSGGGIFHVIVPLLQSSERGLEIHAQYSELRIELER